MTKRAFASPFHDFCQEQRPLLPADLLKGSEQEKLLGQRWQALSPAAKAKRKALLIPVFTCGRGGARTWVPATLEPEVTEAAVEDFMAFVLMDHDIERNASSDRDDVVEWLGLAAGLHVRLLSTRRSPGCGASRSSSSATLPCSRRREGSAASSLPSSALAGCVTRCACARGISLRRWVAQPVV